MLLNSDPSYRGTVLFAVQVAFLVIAWILVLLRAYVKIFMMSKISADDWWMLATMLGYTAYAIIVLWGVVAGGTGEHATRLTVDETVIGLQAWWICEVLYAPISAMVRTSVAIFLLRIATERTHKWVIWANLGVIWLITVAFFFIVTFQCYPVTYFWTQALGAEGRCINAAIVPQTVIVQSVLGVICDLVFAGLPIPMLWNVQLNKRTKMVIALLLSMGFVGGVALLVRIPFIKVLAVSPDFLYETVDVGIWSVMEPSLGIIAGCIATLRPLVKSWGFGKETTAGHPTTYPRSNPPRSWAHSARVMKNMESGSPPTSNTYISNRDSAANTLENGSEIELQGAVQPTGKSSMTRTSIGKASTPVWLDLPRTDMINVRTSIDVTTHEAPAPRETRA